MNELKLYRQKIKAEINGFKADVNKIRARASGASADTQLKLNRQVKHLQHNINRSEKRLAEVTEAGGDAWHSLRDGAESAWGSVRTAVKDARSRFK